MSQISDQLDHNKIGQIRVHLDMSHLYENFLKERAPGSDGMTMDEILADLDFESAGRRRSLYTGQRSTSSGPMSHAPRISCIAIIGKQAIALGVSPNS
jgi:hypothetical protein